MPSRDKGIVSTQALSAGVLDTAISGARAPGA